MKQEQIRKIVEREFANIKQSEEILRDIRKTCKHPETFTGDYSYRVGSIFPAKICSDCYECVEILVGDSEK